MNAKNRALLWEELRVGGFIAVVSVLNGLLVMLSLRFTTEGSAGQVWHNVDSTIKAVSLGIPLMAALLLILNAANTGHLSGGFSKRILRLPVDTSSAVAIVLLTRLALVLVASSVMVGANWLLFVHGPGLRAIVLLGCVYLFIQTLDWARAVVPLLVPVAVIAIVGILLVRVGGFPAWVAVLAGGSGPIMPSLLAFPLSIALAYGVSFVLVKQARAGEQILALHAPAFEGGLPLPWKQYRKPFSSAFSAQVWSETRRAGSFLLAMTALFWVLAEVLRRLIAFGFAERRPNLEAVFRAGWDPLWTFEIFPFAALLLASFAWGLWVGKGDSSKGRPNAFLSRLPLHKEQIAKARLIAAGLNLALCLVAVTAVYTASFLLADSGLIARMMAGRLNAGETNLRELTALIVAPCILVGLLCWFIMGSMTLRKLHVALFFVGAILLVTGVTIAYPIGYLIGGHTEWLLTCILGVVVILALALIVFLAGGLFHAWRRGLVASRSAMVCLAVWVIGTALFYPFSVHPHGYQVVFSLLGSFALGSLAVLPFIEVVLALSYRGPGEPLADEKPRGRADSRSTRVALGLLIGLVFLVFLAWIRWPAEPAWKDAFRAKGLPANLNELDAWYPAAPAGSNRATLYLDAAAKLDRKNAAWWRRRSEKPHPETDVLGKLPIFGNAELKRAKPIPRDDWDLAKSYWEEVACPVSVELHAIAHSAAAGSRYPVDLRKGMAVELSHLSRLRELGRVLSLEALVSGAEHNPGAVYATIADIFPLADSLKEEPVLISQLVRIALYEIAESAFEDAMNRMSFSDSDLARFQDLFLHALPPVEETRIMDRALIGDEVHVLQLADTDDFFFMLTTETNESAAASFLLDCAEPLLDFSAFFGFDRLLITAHFARSMDAAKATAMDKKISSKPEDYWNSHVNARGFLALMLLPAMDRAYEAEWRIRTEFDLARTAAGVERFRLAHDHLPQRLEDLVPAYLDKVPYDLWNSGKPLSYRIKDNGEFVVYSYYRDFKDGLGVENDEEHRGVPRDLTFTVAPPDIRDRAQGTSETK